MSNPDEYSKKQRDEASALQLETLLESKELTRLVLDTITDRFVLLKPDMTVVTANTSWLENSGHATPDEILGHSLHEFAPDFKHSKRHRKYLEVLSTKRKFPSYF